MRHSNFGRNLSRTGNERRRLFMILARELIFHGQITTTLAKAKAVQPLVEKLITRAKKGTESDRRLVFRVLADKASTASLMIFAKTRFTGRTSGFTRIIKLGPRTGDATEEAMLSFVDAPVVTGEVVVPAKQKETVVPIEKETIKKKRIVKLRKTKSVKSDKLDK